jgi:hypothetical protein
MSNKVDRHGYIFIEIQQIKKYNKQAQNNP